MARRHEITASYYELEHARVYQHGPLVIEEGNSDDYPRFVHPVEAVSHHDYVETLQSQPDGETDLPIVVSSNEPYYPTTDFDTYEDAKRFKDISWPPKFILPEEDNKDWYVIQVEDTIVETTLYNIATQHHLREREEAALCTMPSLRDPLTVPLEELNDALENDEAEALIPLDVTKRRYHA